MAAERRMKSLRLRQRSINTSFNLIKTFVDEYNEDTDCSQVPVRLEHLGTLWTDFNKTQAELESIDEAGIDAQFKNRTEFESSYYKVKGFLLAANKTPITPCASSNSQFAGNVPPSASHVRLPDVKLPVFSGNMDNWLNFHDLYLSLSFIRRLIYQIFRSFIICALHWPVTLSSWYKLFQSVPIIMW